MSGVIFALTPQAHFSLDQMSTTLEDLVETAIMLDYNERDAGTW